MDHLSRLNTLHLAKNAIRNPYVWPGGYPQYLVMADGAALSLQAARENWREIVWATLYGNLHSDRDWHVVGVEINWERRIYCAHTGELIECAMDEPEDNHA